MRTGFCSKIIFVALIAIAVFLSAIVGAYAHIYLTSPPECVLYWGTSGIATTNVPDYPAVGSTTCVEPGKPVAIHVKVFDDDSGMEETKTGCTGFGFYAYDDLTDGVWELTGPGNPTGSFIGKTIYQDDLGHNCGYIYTYQFTPKVCDNGYQLKATFNDVPGSNEPDDAPISVYWYFKVRANPQCFDNDSTCSDDSGGSGCSTCSGGSSGLIPQPNMRYANVVAPMPDDGPRGTAGGCPKKYSVEFFKDCDDHTWVSCRTCTCNPPIELTGLTPPYVLTLQDRSKLTITPSGSNMTCDLELVDGTQVDFSAVSFGANDYDKLANPTAVTSPDGQQTTYIYGDTADTITYSDGEVKTYSHSSTDPGRVTSISSNLTGSNHTDISYVTGGPAGGKISSITVKDPSNAELSRMNYTYDDSTGQLWKATDPHSGFEALYEYSYGTNEDIITVTEHSVNDPLPVLAVTEYHYGSNGGEGHPAAGEVWVIRKHASQSSMDQKTVYEYYTSGINPDLRRTYLHKVTDPTGAVTEYTVNETTGRVDLMSTPDGITTAYTYNSKGAVEEITKTAPGSLESTETNGYYSDANGDTVWLSTHEDIRGTVTIYQRDPSTLWQVDAIKILDPATQEEELIKEYTYYTASDPEVTATPSRARVGQLKSETVPDIGGTGQDQVTTYKYYGSGKIQDSPTETIYKDSTGAQRTSTTVYDSLGRVIETEDGTKTLTSPGRKMWYSYDAQGRQTLTVYKWLNDVVGVTPEVFTENHYDCCTMDWSQDENGNRTYYEYDDAKRVKKTWTDIQQPDGEDHPLVAYYYDRFGNQEVVSTRSDATTAVRDTTYTYDKLNRVTKIVYPCDSTEGDVLWSEFFQYDDAGRLAAKLTGLVNSGAITAGNVTAYTYDVWGRLNKVKYEYSAAVWPIPGTITIDDEDADVTYTYEEDYSGSTLRASMHDNSGMSEYTYDRQGRLESYKPPVGLGSGCKVWYDYNKAGQKTRVRITDGTTTPYDVTYAYFANGWLNEVKLDGNKVASYSYDVVGNRTRQWNRNATYTDYAYATGDPRYLLDSITHYRMAGDSPNPGMDPALVDPIEYTRDDAGNPLSMSDWIGEWTYQYDANNRLKEAVPPTPIPEQPAGGPYEYDWVGNRVRPPRDPNPPSATNKMVYNKADQLLEWPGMHTYTYYKDGSLHQEKDAAGTDWMRRYTYTRDGLLYTAEFDRTGPTTCTTLTNTWDADKNRVEFILNSTAHHFVYDTTAGIPAVIQEDDAYYIREPGGALIARKDGSNWSYYHFDQLGSTRLLTAVDENETDKYGGITDKYAYDAYGALLSHEKLTGSVDEPYHYVGRLGYYAHWQEPGLGLMQLGVRFYDSTASRFAEPDPEPRDEEAKYVYGGSNPCARADPSGRSPLIIVGGAALLGGASVVCIEKSLEVAKRLHAINDKLAHCFMACQTTKCLGGGLCQSYFVPAYMSRGESDPNDREANRRGGVCARIALVMPWYNCFSCCRNRVRGLPNDPGVIH